jgi:hypothetical protein
MADIFLSYAHEDRAIASRLAEALGTSGWSSWWDRSIVPGSNFGEVIESELNAASCVIVLWSARARQSNWVHDEAVEAQRRGVLVSATIDGTRPPLGFRRQQTADLSHWDGSPSDPAFALLTAGVRRLVPGGTDDSRRELGERETLRRRWKPLAWIAASVGAAALAVGSYLFFQPARAVPFSGVVVDDAGRGVPRAHVTIPLGGTEAFRYTDEAGRFTFESLPPGLYEGVTASADGYLPVERAVMLGTAPRAEERIVLRRVSPPPSAARLRGVVRDEAGNALPGAMVTARGPGPERRAASDAGGGFEIGGLDAGTYLLTAEWRNDAGLYTLAEPQRVALEGGEAGDLPLTLRLSAGRRQDVPLEQKVRQGAIRPPASAREKPARPDTGNLSGIVFDDAGERLPGITIELVFRPTGARRTAVSDDTGSFRFPRLPPGGPYELTVALPGFEVETREFHVEAYAPPIYMEVGLRRRRCAP